MTESDSWMCPECEDKKKSSKRRGRPKKQTQSVSKRISTDTDDNFNKKSKQIQASGKNPAKGKAPLKKQISKEYISEIDTSDPEEEIIKEPRKSEGVIGDDIENQRGDFVSDSLTDTDDDENKETAGIIRIPMDVSQLSNSNSSSETD